MLIEAFYLARWLARHAALRRWAAWFIGISGLVTLLVAWYLRFYVSSGPFWQAGWLGTLFQDFLSEGTRVAARIGVLILLALLWWRGLWLGRDKIEFDQVARSFKVGFAALVAALVLLGTVDAAARGALAVQLGLTLPLFLFVGLASLSLARLSEIRHGRRSQGPGASQADPTRSWVLAMLVLSGALVVLLLGIEQAFSYGALLAVVSALKPIWDGISTVVGWIAVGLGYVLYWLFSPFAGAIQALFNKANAPNQPSSPPSQPGPPLKGKPGALPTDWLVAAQWVLISIGVMLLLVILIRIFRGLAAWRRDEEVDEERESLAAGSILGAQLRALLASLAARFQRKGAAEDETETIEGHSVRALYRRVLRQASARGLGRRTPETPQEFARRLLPALAELPATVSSSENATIEGAVTPSLTEAGIADPDLEALTIAYEQARYGGNEPSAAQMAALTSAVDRLLQRLAQRQAETSGRAG